VTAADLTADLDRLVTVRREVRVGPAAVWRVLADGWLYPSWVVGATRMRNVDPDWPAPGSVLDHSVGSWPLVLDDNTEVVDAVPDRLLALRARGWPFGEADIRLVLEPRPTGCEIVMGEDAVTGPGSLLPRPVRVAAIAPRNLETLRRLAYLAEGGAR
jgi:hypothetical protein